MTMQRFISQPKMAALRQRLAAYSQTYPDSDFLDTAAGNAGAGRPFTPEFAAAVEDALANWERRLRGPSWDPDRCPPGSDPLIWKLATRYRDAMEEHGWTCPSRRLVYTEIRRITERDKLRGNYAPWRDEPGAPGWYRMLRDVITAWTAEYTAASPQAAWYAHEQLAQPGEVTAVIAGLREAAKLRHFSARARPVTAAPPAPERRAAVKAWIAARHAARTE